MEEQQSKLVLMFDVNKTLVMLDKATHKSLQCIVFQFISWEKSLQTKLGALLRKKKLAERSKPNGN